MRREVQQYGERLQVEPLRSSWKSMVVISGSSRSQASWWRKKDAIRGTSSNKSSDSGSGSWQWRQKI